MSTSHREAKQLRRAMGFGDLLLFFIITGFHVRWAATGAAAGPSSLVVWIGVCAVFYVPLVFCVLELSSRFPEEGGLYLWTKLAFGDFAGFLTGWTYWTSNFPYFATLLYFTAGSALFIGGARWQYLANDPTYFITFSLLGLCVATGLNLVGLRVGKWLHNLGAIGSWVPAGILIALGAIAGLSFGSATDFTAASLLPSVDLKGAVFLSTMAFTLIGPEAASFMGEEIANARRNVPRALLIAGPIITGTYILATVALLLVLPQRDVGPLEAILQAVTTVEQKLGSVGLTPLVAVLLTLGGIGMCGAWLAATARLPFVAGVDRVLPAAFGRLHPRWGTPYVALLVEALIAAVFIFLGQAGTTVKGAYTVLVGMCLLPTYFPFLLLFAAWYKLQDTPAGPGVFRPPGGKDSVAIMSILGFMTTLVSMLLAVVPPEDEADKPLAIAKVVGLSVVLLVVGVCLFLAGKWRSADGTWHMPVDRQDLWDLASIGLIVLIGGAAWYFGDRLATWATWATWAALLAALALFLRRRGERWFGPVLIYEVVRNTRRGRHVVLRCIYAGVLLFSVYVAYRNMLNRAGIVTSDIFTTHGIPRNVLPRFGEDFFILFAWLQFAVVILLTPFYTAGAVTEEKERKTLEYLFTTDLANREIILGKLLARLGNMLLLLLAALPILGLLQFLGGMDPNQVLAIFAATALLMLSVASLSLLASVYNTTTWDAVLRTYLTVFFYFIGTSAAGPLLAYWLMGPRVMPFLTFGNPILGYVNLEHAGSSTLEPEAVLLWTFVEYSCWHLLFAAVCCVWAILRLRAVAVNHASEPAKAETPTPIETAAAEVPASDRRPVGEEAMLWKEIYAEPHIRWRRGNQVLDGCALSFIFIAALTVPMLVWYASSDLSTDANGLVRVLGTALGTFMLLLVGGNAAGRISRERERQTFDGLLTTPLSTDELLWAKWLGSVGSVRLLGWFFVWFLPFGVLSGGLHVAALPLAAVGWTLYAVTCAGIGLAFSLMCRSTVRATILTVLTILALMIGPWLLGTWAVPGLLGLRGRDAEFWIACQGVALSPPSGLFILLFRANDFAEIAGPSSWLESHMGDLLLAVQAGWLVYGAATAALWWALRRRLRAVVVRPDRIDIATATESD